MSLVRRRLCLILWLKPKKCSFLRTWRSKRIPVKFLRLAPLRSMTKYGLPANTIIKRWSSPLKNCAILFGSLSSPAEAFSLSRDYEDQVREDWYDIRVEVMQFIVTEKFRQNPQFALFLTNTEIRWSKNIRIKTTSGAMAGMEPARTIWVRFWWQCVISFALSNGIWLLRTSLFELGY